MDSMADDFSGFEGSVGEDPKAMGQMMRRMGKEMGEELPPEFDEVVDRLESGQSPEDIEKAILTWAANQAAMRINPVTTM